MIFVEVILWTGHFKCCVTFDNKWITAKQSTKAHAPRIIYYKSIAHTSTVKLFEILSIITCFVLIRVPVNKSCLYVRACMRVNYKYM